MTRKTLKQIFIFKIKYITTMKYILGIFTYLLAVSCSTSKSKIDTNIGEWIKKYAHNPDSYEPISTKALDTIFFLDKIKQEIESNSDDFNRNQIKSYEDNVKRFGKNKFYLDQLNEYKAKVKESNKQIEKLQMQKDSILNSSDKNPVLGYNFVHECRIKVPLGGLMLKSIVFQTDKDLNIIIGSEL
jgi:hypothetical protein